ncbi:hypothetical protein [Streptomyces niveus]|uniref:hypothetical protein n=1 Tax=Streptomyces niveus TaxID=193462 RepID=UPI0034139152
MTSGVNRESGKASPDYPHGSIPLPSAGETSWISRTDVRVYGSLLIVAILAIVAVVIVIVLPAPSSWPGYWPLALPLVAMLLRASRGSVLHRVHYRWA